MKPTTSRDYSLDLLRMVLLMGVILIHSNVSLFLGADAASWWSVRLISFISRDLFGGCVPVFFIISGYLFFANAGSLTRSVYVSKLKSRISTLLVPYVLWNILGAGFFLLKALFMGFNGYRVVVDGRIDVAGLFEGFWVLTDDMPYDAPFWFIRNLMVMVVLAPVFYFVARRTWLAVLLLVPGIFVYYQFSMGIYFLIGAWIAYHRPSLRASALTYFAPLIVFSLVLTLWQPEMTESVRELCQFLRNIGLGAVLAILCRRYTASGRRISLVLPGLTFFVYAAHGLVCGAICRICLALAGDYAPGLVFAAYIASIALIVGLSAGAYYILKSISPRITSILTGSRFLLPPTPDMRRR